MSSSDSYLKYSLENNTYKSIVMKIGKTGIILMTSLLSLPLCNFVFAGGSEAELVTLPGSKKNYTEKQINNFFEVPDWYPNDHIEMPTVVSHGVKPSVFGCASCHLTSGSGHPESAALAGLSVEYQIRQMKAYQKFQRDSIAGTMISIGKPMTDKDIRESAEYFAALPPLKVQEVLEVEQVPVTYVNNRFMRLIVKEAGDKTEAIGDRIITVPVDEYRVKARDPYAQFITYVPPGSLEIGKHLVTLGKGSAAPCGSCHGSELRGTAIAPLIAGQHASYLMSQLRSYKEGTRRGQADPGQIMANNMKYFTDSEILAIAAYVGSLERN
jgi:cytochrome c553